MKKSKQKNLEAAGWKVGDSKEFLGLSSAEVALVETKRALTRMLKDARTSSKVTQEELAEILHSSQSRVAKMEAASADVSLDLILRALFALGITRRQVGRAMSQLEA